MTMVRKALTRQQHKQVHDLRQHGKEVGAYRPIFSVIDPTETAQSFYGQQRYVDDKRRHQMQRKLQKEALEIENTDRDSRETSIVKDIMKRKRQLRSKQDNLKPSLRPDPFQPAKSWYQDRSAHESIPADSKHTCANCIRKGSPFSAFNDWEKQKISANWQFSARVNSHSMGFGGYCPHKTITEGYFNVTDSRFESNPGSTFCGGEVMDTSANS